MSRDYELDRLKSEEQSLFQAKQAALARWHDAQERANAAYNLSQEAWNARVSAKETLSYEYNQMVQSSENYRDVWDEYGHIREYNNFRMPKSAPSLAKLRRLDKTQSCTDSSAFHAAKADFDRTKTEHQSREAEFKRLKAERDRLKAEFTRFI